MNTSSTTLAVDVMGGDYGPPVTVPACVNFLAKNTSIKLILVGDQQQIRQHIGNNYQAIRDRLAICHASQVIGMHEKPTTALRTKPDASMRVALNLVRAGTAQGCVSAGNTGALMVISRFILKTFPGVDRPALVKAVPTRRGYSYLLDLGANVDCQAQHLAQFAIMASVLVEHVVGVQKPTIALLNVGQEPIKGNEQVKHASHLIRSNPHLNYIGFIEGDAIFTGEADIIVCDGFVGNVALKTAEGLLTLIEHYLDRGFRENSLRRVAGFLARPVLAKLKKQIQPKHYNGASFLGLQGTVVKSHGGADSKAFENAIAQAYQEISCQLPEQINESFESFGLYNE